MKQQTQIRYLKPKSIPKYPANYERDYYRILRAVVRKLKQYTADNIYIVRKALHNDDVFSETGTGLVVQNFTDIIIALLAKSMAVEEAKKQVKAVLSGTDRNVKANILQAFAETCSVDIFLNDSQLLQSIEAEWLAQQSRLIDSVVSTYTDKLQTIVSNAVQRGEPMEDVEHEIQELYGVTDKRAKFIARNEVSNLNGIITKQRQVDCGINVYQWSTSNDERVRKSHAEMDGKYYYWNGDKLGEINGIKVYPAPKYHPGMDYNCRCVAIAVLDLAAWNMTNAVPTGEVKPKAIRAVSAIDTQKAQFEADKQEVLKLHNKILTTEQRHELDEALDKVKPEELQFYRDYAKQGIARNLYHERNKGFYRPSEKRVYMDIADNDWEIDAGYKRKAALKTKFHEEFHQIDHMMGNTELTKYENSSLYATTMTNTLTVTGAKLSAAIEQDLVKFFNEAITDYNKGLVQQGFTPLKMLKSTAKLPRGVSFAVEVYLRKLAQSEKDRAMLDTLTDAIGLHTKGRIHPYSWGFWGHTKQYCQSRGKDGATSELWANFGAYIYAFDNDTRAVIEKYMPNSIHAYRKVFQDVLEYARKNGIKYR